MSMPDMALSVRQPWAWAIIYAGKDVENRSAAALRYMSPIKGRRAIHASKGMTREEYENCRDFMASIGVKCPPPAELQRGGIIGSVTVADVVRQSESPWFLGPRGLVLADPEPSVFIPVAGSLGLFRWKDRPVDSPSPPARWMLANDGAAAVISERDLFTP